MRLSRFKFRAIALGLLCVILFALCGCGETTETTTDADTPHDTRDFYETINGIEWCVSYYSETREIVSIYSTMTENDTSSEYYQFISRYHGDKTMCAMHTVSLSGKPVGNDWYQIEQVEAYIMPFMDEDDFERVKNTYPSCRFDAQNHSITLSTRTTRYDERLIFEKMSD